MKQSDCNRQFESFLSGKSSRFWLIYGIGGMGKSYQLGAFSQKAKQDNYACLLFKSPAVEKDYLLAESLLRQASIAGQSIIDSALEQTSSFIKLCHKLQTISPIELLEKETTTNDQVTGLAKLLFSVPRLLGQYQYRDTPEKALLEALQKDLIVKPLLLLLSLIHI